MNSCRNPGMALLLLPGGMNVATRSVQKMFMVQLSLVNAFEAGSLWYLLKSTSLDPNHLKKESDLEESSCASNKPGGNLWKKNVGTHTWTSSLNVHQDLITKLLQEDVQ
ncbi:hypothetical protein TURU_137031 [Turdus rufiventris]|nr:hypothetical protein TURU_137031 [Turdus rufiventris]